MPKTYVTWKDKEARKLQRKILSAIDNRVKDSRRPATAKALRDTLEHSVHPDTLRHATEVSGISRNSKAPELFDLLYGLNWIMQFKDDHRQAKLVEYFTTPWGVDTKESNT